MNKKITIILSAVFIFVALLGITLSVKADSTLIDKIANVAGTVLGNRLFEQVSEEKIFGASEDGDSNFTNVVASGDVTVGDDLAVTGTATIASSYDGFFIQNAITVATGTVTTVYTNNTGADLMCSRAAGAAYWNSTALSDSIKFSLGEATDVDLIATTTIATSTDTITAFGATTNFILESGNTIKAYLADYSPVASSTYYSNWTAEVGLLCRLIGG